MGLVSLVLSFTRIADRFGAKVSDVKHDSGGGANEVSEHFQTANVDSAPLPDDYAACVPVQRKGNTVTVGYLDPNQEQTAQPGEHRAYARNPDDGTQTVQVYLKNDGTALVNNDSVSVELKPDGTADIQNGSGFITLQADGVVNINGFVIETNGAATSPVSVTAPTLVGNDSVQAGGKELVDHKHEGSPTAATGPKSDTGANL